MAWWMWSLVANVAITAIEYLNRTAGFASPLDAFKVTAPLIVVAQIGLLYAWKGAPSMMVAWAVFSAANLAIRLASSHFLVGEPLSWRGWVGVTLMFVGMWVVKAGHGQH